MYKYINNKYNIYIYIYIYMYKRIEVQKNEDKGGWWR
jgi:hypothetical protein